MKTVICVPYRPRPGTDELWSWVNGWITNHYGYPIHVGDTEGNFSPSKARNAAATLAGDWDVAVFHDADTIAHPEAVEQAITAAANSMQMVVAADSHMYCDPASSRRILAGSPIFPRPDKFDRNHIYEKPCSGIVAVNRNLYEKVGGYVETLQGWGYEDLVFLQMCGIFADGNTWIPGHISLHIWHEPSPLTRHTTFNKQVWQKLADYRRRNNPAGARTYLQTLGHTVP